MGLGGVLVGVFVEYLVVFYFVSVLLFHLVAVHSSFWVLGYILCYGGWFDALSGCSCCGWCLRVGFGGVDWLFRFVILGLFVVPSLVPCGFLGCSVYFGVFRCSCFAVAFGGLSCVLGLGLMVVLCLWWVGWLGGVGCLFVRLGIWCPAAGCLSVNW